MTRVFITGSAGFIGYHLARRLLDDGMTVAGFDAMTDYYDVALKERRHAMLTECAGFSATQARLEDQAALDRAVDDFAPDVIVHLAGQAGVRHSIDHPRAHLDANVVGAFHVLEAARRHKVRHLLMASTSSVYGANTKMPFGENDRADTQMTIYAATKKAAESMAHAYAHLHDLPVTMFRFFTVYGPWGRPDMALFSFVDAIRAGQPIDVYHQGEMFRDFTYIDDLTQAIRLLMDVVPVRPADGQVPAGDSLSPVAPYRVVNIGNGACVRLLDFIAAIEDAVGQTARKTMLPMQQGDVPATWANADLLAQLTGYRPQTDVRDGVRAFVDWHRAYFDW